MPVAMKPSEAMGSMSVASGCQRSQGASHAKMPTATEMQVITYEDVRCAAGTMKGVSGSPMSERTVMSIPAVRPNDDGEMAADANDRSEAGGPVFACASSCMPGPIPRPVYVRRWLRRRRILNINDRVPESDTPDDAPSAPVRAVDEARRACPCRGRE